jgi:FkbM family methyltransferase
MQFASYAQLVVAFFLGILAGSYLSLNSAHYTTPGQLVQKTKAPTLPPTPAASNASGFETYDLAYKQVTVNNHQYFLPRTSVIRPAVAYFSAGRYFEQKTHDTIEGLLSQYPGSMVHAGTFFGDMVPHFATLIKRGNHAAAMLYAFEPNTKSYLLAQKAVEANNLSNVVLFNAALGPSVGQVRIQTKSPDGKSDHGGMSFVETGGGGNQRVPSVTIDMLEIRKLSILQLDVEGYEDEALKGALETIRREKPILALEDSKDRVQALLSSTLSELRYKSMCSSPSHGSSLVYYATPDRFEKVQEIVRNYKGCAD